MSTLILLGLAIAGAVAVIAVVRRNNTKAIEARNQREFDDAVADARRWIDRLGSQVLSIAGSDTASTQAMADASERFNAASAQISTASSAAQAKLARESALEGLHYINAAREIMGMPAGPELPPLEGQKTAGRVTEDRTIEFDGREITASPHASDQTPNYYPGGRVAGRPVPAGWYSEPWWASALTSGMWAMSSMMMFNMMFAGMAGVGYSGQDFQDGYDEGFQAGQDSAGGEGDGGSGDGGDGGDAGDTGGDSGDGGDGGWFDFGGGDGDGGGFDFGGFDF